MTTLSGVIPQAYLEALNPASTEAQGAAGAHWQSSPEVLQPYIELARDLAARLGHASPSQSIATKERRP